MIFKFVAVSRSSQTLKILHNTITVKPQSHYVNFILISTVLMNKQPDYIECSTLVLLCKRQPP